MHTSREYFYHFWKKASEKQSRKKFFNHFKDDLERYRQCADKKPKKQINSEMKILQRYWGCFPFQYYRYDFYKADCRLTMDEMRGYVPNFFMYNLFFPRSFMDYGILCEHKGYTNAILKGFRIPQPNTILRYDNRQFFNELNISINEEETNRILEQSTAKKLFVKPTFGLGGQGILIYHKNSMGNFVDGQDNPVTARYLYEIAQNKSYVLQEGLEQHDEISGIYPHSVNTFRIVTMYYDGKPWILYTLLRMGKAGKQVDNSSAGGLYIKVETEKGQLHDFAYTHNRIKFEAHPDTGFVFKNAKIDNWPVIKAFVLKEIEKFREIKYLGWDVALSKDGPVVIELNNGPDVEILQDFYGGLKDDFQIIPSKWWYNNKFTLKELP